MRRKAHARFLGGWARATASGYPTKVAGQWKYLYRALDRDGDTIDFLLCAKRDCAAARRFLERVVRPMLGFKTFRCARVLIAGIETTHMIRKG